MGKSCRECFHFEKCQRLVGAKETWVGCDWEPSNFTPIPDLIPDPRDGKIKVLREALVMSEAKLYEYMMHYDGQAATQSDRTLTTVRDVLELTK